MRRRRYRNLRAYRRALGLTQEEAAAQVAISQVHWSRLERGQVRASPDLAQQLADITGIPVLVLLGLNDAPRSRPNEASEVRE
jgi:transcriptional regulator with XRE-family HTH domain